MTRLLITGLVLLAVLLPLAPVLVICLVGSALLFSLPAARALIRVSTAAEQRLSLLSVRAFRGPPRTSPSR